MVQMGSLAWEIPYAMSKGKREKKKKNREASKDFPELELGLDLGKTLGLERTEEKTRRGD